MTDQLSNKSNERRQAPDKWIYTLRIIAVFSWLLFIIAMVVSYYAAPEESYGYLRYKDIEVRESWLKPLTNYLYIILWVSALFSLISLFISSFRSRREQDSKMFNLVLLMITTIAWITYIYTQVE